MHTADYISLNKSYNISAVCFTLKNLLQNFKNSILHKILSCIPEKNVCSEYQRHLFSQAPCFFFCCVWTFISKRCLHSKRTYLVPTYLCIQQVGSSNQPRNQCDPKLLVFFINHSVHHTQQLLAYTIYLLVEHKQILSQYIVKVSSQ